MPTWRFALNPMVLASGTPYISSRAAADAKRSPLLKIHNTSHAPRWLRTHGRWSDGLPTCSDFISGFKCGDCKQAGFAILSGCQTRTAHLLIDTRQEMVKVGWRTPSRRRSAASRMTRPRHTLNGLSSRPARCAVGGMALSQSWAGSESRNGCEGLESAGMDRFWRRQ